MADLYYYEEGYIDDKYHVYIARAEIYISPYFEDGYIDAGYYLDYSAVGSLTCDAELVTGVTVEASGTWTSEFTVSAQGIRYQQAESAQTATFAQSVDATNFRGFDLALATTATQTAVVGRIQEAEAAFTDAFTPTLTADAFKNYTAVIDSVATMTTDSAVNRSANILLEHIADLNAMAAKTAVFDSNLSTTVSTTTTPVKIIDATASFAVTATVIADGFDVKFADSALQARSQVFASRYLGTDRPVTVTGTFNSGYLVNSATRSSILSRLSKEPNWFFQINGYIQPTGNWQTVDVEKIFEIPLGNKGSASCSIRYRSAQGVTFTVAALGVSGSVATGPLFTNFQEAVNFNIAVSYTDNGRVAVYVNNTRLAVNTINTAGWTIPNPGNVNFAPDFPYTLSGSTHNCYIDTAWLTYGDYTNNGSATYTNVYPLVNTVDTIFLYEFANGQETTSISHSANAALSTTSTFSTQANANTKQGNALIAATATQTVTAVKAIEASATVSEEINIVTDATKIIQYNSDLNTAVALVDGLERIRFGESTQNSLFSPSVTVQATKVGETVLQSQFSVTVDANSFTEVPAALTSEFAVTADIDGIARITSASLSTATAVSAVIGTQESATVSISGAFNATVSAEYFEGTSLIAPMTASMTVTAQKTARITRTLPVISSVSADVRENAQAPAANGITSTYQERIDVTLNYTYTYVKTSSTRRSFSFTSDTAVPGGQVGIGALSGSSLFPNGTLLVSNSASANVQMHVYVYGQSGQSDWYDVYTYDYDLGIVDSVNLGGNQFVNGSGTLRLVFDAATTGLLTAYLDGSATPISLPAPITTFKNRIYWPSFEPFYISNQNGRFGWPPILFPTVNNIRSNTGNTNLALTSVAYSDEAYNLYYGPQEYAVADLVDLDFASLSVSAITVVFLQAGLLAGTFAQTTSGNRIRFGTSTLTAQITVSANAGLQAVGTASVNAASTLQASVARTRSTTAAVAVASTIACEPTRVRYQSADIASEFAQTTQAVKQTGNVIALETTVTQTAQGQRIRYADSEFSAFNSTVTAAAKNATGTVTLESQFAQSTQAEKNAVGVITLEAEFTETTNTADGKIVGFSSDQNSEFTQETIGDRIQPAGADMVSEFTLVATTNGSKITRITADSTVTVTVTADVERFRDTVALQASAGTMTVEGDRIRFADAAVSDSFSILASPTFIVRITADFTAFYSQLSVGDVINLDPFLTLTIEPETRSLFILPENRIISIESETRVNII